LYAFEGVAAEVSDVNTVIEALRIAVNSIVVVCDEGTADARLVTCAIILSIALDFPDPAIPLFIRNANTKNSIPYNDDLILCSSSSMFPNAIRKFFHTWPLFLPVIRLRTRKLD
jgi:hypothetical protein